MSARPAAPTGVDHPNDFDATVAFLRGALASPLPGLDAHLAMAPKPRVGWRPAVIPDDARAAAALILLYPVNGRATLPLTVRAPTLLHHGGQVALPGGAVEPGESVEHAALREAAEEVGIDAAGVTVLGRLSPLHIPVSGFVLHPVIGVLDDEPVFRPDPGEVARIVRVSLAQLCDPHAVRLRMRLHEGREYEVPYFAIDGEQVWGATAMVLGELLWLLHNGDTHLFLPSKS